MNINKTYLKLDQLGNILGAYRQFTETPQLQKVFCVGINFDVEHDFENAIETEVDIHAVEIGKSTYVNGIFESNGL